MTTFLTAIYYISTVFFLWDEFSEEYNSQLKSKLVLVLVLIWMFIGLFTFQWAGFVAIFLFNLLIIAPLSKITRYSITYTIIHWFNSLIGLTFGLFVIINHYHLKIDLTQWFLSFIK